MTPETIMRKYRERIVAIMERIADVLREEGYLVGGPEFWDGDDYRWVLLVHVDGDSDKLGDEDVDISFKLCESEEYDGTPGGVNFALDIVQVGGRIIGGLTPFNYTERCWVPRNDSEAVEERFRIMEQADEGDIPALIERHQPC